MNIGDIPLTHDTLLTFHTSHLTPIHSLHTTQFVVCRVRECIWAILSIMLRSVGGGPYCVLCDGRHFGQMCVV